MWLHQRLLFYTAPRIRGKTTVMYWMVTYGAVLFAELLFPAPVGCVISPNSDTSGSESVRACTATEVGTIVAGYCAIALLGVLIWAIVRRVYPIRHLDLKVTADGLISHFSRFPEEVIGWESIESIGLYEDVARAASGDAVYYLVVTVFSSDGMHESAVMEDTWRAYPRAPDMERVALMLPLERPSDANGARISPEEVVFRIRVSFAPQIETNEVEVFEPARLL